MLGVYRIQIGPYFYIGSSNNCEKRKKEHKRHLESGDHYNPKMLAVYRKYGDFNFKVIEQTDTELQCRQREKSYIDLHFNDKHCLNISTEALCPPKTVKKTYWDGKTYPSRISAHKASGLRVHLSNFREMYNQGFRTTEDVLRYLENNQVNAGRLVAWNNSMESRKSISQRLQIGSGKLKQCIAFGAKCDDDVLLFTENAENFDSRDGANPSCRLAAYWNGRHHSSMREIKSKYSLSTIKKYIELGCNSDKQVAQAKRKNAKPYKPYETKSKCTFYSIDGEVIQFISCRSATDSLGVNYDTHKTAIRLNGFSYISGKGVLIKGYDTATTEEVRQHLARLHGKR